MVVSVLPTFYSAGCNREPNVIDWNCDRNMIAYGSSSNVVLYNPSREINAIVSSLHGHKGDVTCVRWIKQQIGTTILPSLQPQNTNYVGQIVSGGFDGLICVWDIFQDGEVQFDATKACSPGLSGRPISYQLATTLSVPEQHLGVQPPNDQVTAVDVLSWKGVTIIAAATASGFVNIFARNDNKTGTSSSDFVYLQSLGFGPAQLMQAVSLHAYTFHDGVSCVLLALAGVSTKVHLFSCHSIMNNNDEHADTFIQSNPSSTSATVEDAFFPLGELDGHTDWIRSLSFCLLDEDQRVPTDLTEEDFSRKLNRFYQGDALFLASASQDRTVRLWRFSPPALSAIRLLAPSAVGLEATDATDVSEDADGHDVLALEAIASSSLGEQGRLYRLGASLEVGRHAKEGAQNNAVSRMLSVTLDSVLIGHEDWVCSAVWHPTIRKVIDGIVSMSQPLALLTASTDKTMMIWRPDENYGSSMWLNEMRVGESGGHTLGLFSARFGPNGDAIIGLGHSGCFHLWARSGTLLCPNAESVSSDINDINSGELTAGWTPVLPVSGHNAAVVSFVFSTCEKTPYILSIGADQTTRIFAPWRSLSSDPSILSNHWFEISRPQVHGWDLESVCLDPLRPHCFVSAAEEKVLRIFSAPLPFIGTLKSLVLPKEQREVEASPEALLELFSSNITTTDTSDLSVKQGGVVKRALAANQPELGLSNKPILVGDDYVSDGVMFPRASVDTQFAPAEIRTGLKQVFYSRPPIEDELISHSLWPEVEKLYSHGYDVEVVAAANYLPMFVSAASGRSMKNSALRVWDARTYDEIDQLKGHAQTVSHAVFSPKVYSPPFARPSPESSADRYLLTVSKDQSFALWTRSCTDEDAQKIKENSLQYMSEVENPSLINLPTYELKLKVKAHTRQIYAACWDPSGTTFFTAGRDKTLKIWKIKTNEETNEITPSLIGTIDSRVPITTLSCIAASNAWILAAGMEDGSIDIFESTNSTRSMADDECSVPETNNDGWVLMTSIDQRHTHSSTVNTIQLFESQDNTLGLISCGGDNSLRVWTIKM